MNEKEFKKRLKERLQRELGDEIELREGRRVKVEMNKNLIYKVVVNENFMFEPNNPREPRRGKYAFQTDLLIRREDNLPLVAIEIKYRSPSTHHILILLDESTRT